MKKAPPLSLLRLAMAGLTCLVVGNPRLHAASEKARAAIWVSPDGNDRTGLRGRFDFPFQHAWDVLTNDAGHAMGACKVAKPGDVIVFTPGVHLVGSVPLPDDVDLWAMPGAVLLRTDFTNGTSHGAPASLPANLSTCGPMILPGRNSQIDLRFATCIATNAVYDAVVGWFETLDTRGVFGQYGFDNKPKANVVIFGGKMIGSSDVVYFTQTDARKASVTMEGGELRSGWDAIRLHGNVVLSSRDLEIFSTNTISVRISQGAAISGGAKWIDFNSRIGSGGGTNRNFAVHADGCAVELNLTSLYTTGTEGLPLLLTNGATATGHAITNGVPVWLGGNLTGTPGLRRWLVRNPGPRFLLRTDTSTNLTLTPLR